MPNPYKVYQKNKGPGWLKGLDKYIEKAKPASNEVTKKDNAAAERNFDGDKSAIDEATYVAKGK